MRQRLRHVIAGVLHNDGFVDLYIGRLDFTPGECSLYHNNGDGTFYGGHREGRRETLGFPITSCWVTTTIATAIWIFSSRITWRLFERPIPNRLFHNNGDGTFTE